MWDHFETISRMISSQISYIFHSRNFKISPRLAWWTRSCVNSLNKLLPLTLDQKRPLCHGQVESWKNSQSTLPRERFFFARRCLYFRASFAFTTIILFKSDSTLGMRDSFPVKDRGYFLNKSRKERERESLKLEYFSKPMESFCIMASELQKKFLWNL